jgi:hypothetical protein
MVSLSSPVEFLGPYDIFESHSATVYKQGRMITGLHRHIPSENPTFGSLVEARVTGHTLAMLSIGGQLTTLLAVAVALDFRSRKMEHLLDAILVRRE